MSRVGKNPVPLPAKVTVKVDKDNKVTVNGPKGTLSQQFDPDMNIGIEESQVVVTRPTDQREHRAQHGLTRALIANMVKGVTDGFTRRLEIVGVGYRAEQRGNNLVLNVGKSHPVEFAPPTKDIVFEVAKDGRSFSISGIDKAEVGQLAAVVRMTRPPEPYQGKGIRYAGRICTAESWQGRQGRQEIRSHDTMAVTNRGVSRKRRHLRVRKKVSGTPTRPRLNVYRSLEHIYAQIIDDTTGMTLVSASTVDTGLRGELASSKKTEQAKQIGKALAERALQKGIKEVVFDRGGYPYHGRVKALAEGSREAGLVF